MVAVLPLASDWEHGDTGPPVHLYSLTSTQCLLCVHLPAVGPHRGFGLPGCRLGSGVASSPEMSPVLTTNI